MVGGKMNTRETEVARRQDVVRLGKLQLLMIERRRQLEKTERRIQERLGRSLDLERVLAEVERDKELEQEGTKAEILRRSAVVKVWRLQVKVMERRRQLERMLEELRQQFIKEDEREKLVEDMEMKMVRAEMAEKLAQQLQPIHAQLDEVKVMMETMMTSLEEVETLQQEDQQQTETLR